MLSFGVPGALESDPSISLPRDRKNAGGEAFRSSLEGVALIMFGVAVLRGRPRAELEEAAGRILLIKPNTTERYLHSQKRPSECYLRDG